MNPGSVFFDEQFAFHDGENGEKLFVVLGTVQMLSVVAPLEPTAAQNRQPGSLQNPRDLC
jgi:hypothetical protein